MNSLVHTLRQVCPLSSGMAFTLANLKEEGFIAIIPLTSWTHYSLAQNPEKCTPTARGSFTLSRKLWLLQILNLVSKCSKKSISQAKCSHSSISQSKDIDKQIDQDTL